jgi:hypothetical protein
MSYREFKDENGRQWRVWDVAQPSLSTRATAGGLRPEFAQGWIAFECDTEKRRLVQYPKEWATLPDSELARLCQSAKLARKEGGEETANPGS